jgi:hypothetical protein
MTDSSALNYDTDMETISSYVQAVVEKKNKIAIAYLSAIDNLQTTIQTASPSEAKQDILSAVMKSGLKSVISAVKGITSVDLDPLAEMIRGIKDEIDRAEKSEQNFEVSDTQDQTGENLRKQIEDEYNQNDEGGRGGYIAGIEIKLEAMRSVQAPKTEILEVAMYTCWINQNFNDDCIDGTGIVYIQFEDNGTFSSATLISPLGDKISGALNNVMSRADVYQLMDLDVVKKVCKGDDCMCFEGNNEVRKASWNDETQSFLTSHETWKQVKNFG